MLATALTSKGFYISALPTGPVFSHAVGIFAFDDFGHFAILQSNIHEQWAWHVSSTMRSAGIRYTPSIAFETFPFPDHNKISSLESVGKAYHAHRRTLMEEENIGLTSLYNGFHSPTLDGLSPKAIEGVKKLRALHKEMDEAVLHVYGWDRSSAPDGISLQHDFHEVDYLSPNDRIRFTISEPARREVLQRLLKLNHERYAEEVAAGLHDKKASKLATSKKLITKAEPTGATLQADWVGDGQMGLFDEGQGIRGEGRGAEKGMRGEGLGAEKGVRGEGQGARTERLVPNPSHLTPNPSPLIPSILDYLRNHPGWHSKDTLLKGTGFPENRWNAAIKELLDSGQVEREGEKRGSRYRIKEVRGEG